VQEKKEKLITPEKRSLNVCSKGLRDFRRLREQLAKQPAIKGARPQQEPEITR
jgi:hypothetical protein